MTSKNSFTRLKESAIFYQVTWRKNRLEKYNTKLTKKGTTSESKMNYKLTD